MTLNVVIRWKKGRPAKRDEPWFLIPDLPGNAVPLTELSARRMAVEELLEALGRPVQESLLPFGRRAKTPEVPP
jgi:hypothetical protein